jgi:hypothetical protein
VPPADADGQLSHGLSAAPSGRDLLLGVASLDLSSLTLLGCVDGWYNILDTQQQTRGQIKVGYRQRMYANLRREGRVWGQGA